MDSQSRVRRCIRSAFALFGAFGIMLAAFLTFGTSQVSAAGPFFVDGNPTCTSLGYGYTYGFKPQPEPPPSGTYALPGDPVNTVTIDSDGTFVSWSSTIGIDAIIVKGGSNANLYTYDPEATSDGPLSSPINPNNGQPFGISHLEFCYDYNVSVTKTAETSFTRTYSWSIAKSVTPAAWELFVGDTGVSNYAVTVDQTTVDSNWAVNGTISITNPDPFSAANVSVSDVISGGISATVNCPGTSIAPLGVLLCTYSANLPDGTARVNTATVTTTGAVGGGSDTADVVFGSTPTTTVGYPSVNVNDTNGSSWPFNGDGTQTYSKTFACENGTDYEHPNTATIVETGQSASANVDVNCNNLDVTKTAETERTRTWTWTIAKIGDQTALTLSPGQSFLVNYDVTVDATSNYSNRIVSGEIKVHNPAPIAATINSVTDIVSPDINAPVDCGVTFPHQLAAGAMLTCSYEVTLPDTAPRTNTATATLQNYSYDANLVATPNGTTNRTGTAAIDFDAGTTDVVDECIDVTDDKLGPLGTVCADGPNKVTLPKVIEYSLTVGPYAVCGDYTYVNVASFVTTDDVNDTDATGSDDHTVNVNVPCAGGCTLTQGYWKTHSANGPAPEDADWMKLGDADGDGTEEGADETFFKSGKTYYEVLWTAPAGNPYYNLAHQYIAAKLNVLNGASTTTAVDSALTEAKTILEQAPTTSWTRAQKSNMTSLSSTLDGYNNGLIGPGHCSE